MYFLDAQRLNYAVVGFEKIKLIEHMGCNPLLRLALPDTLQSFYIPLLFQTLGRNKLANNGVHHLSTQIGDSFADIIGIQQTVPLVVDHLTLIVSHIILFEQVLTKTRVAAFDFALGLFNGVGDHAML